MRHAIVIIALISIMSFTPVSADNNIMIMVDTVKMTEGVFNLPIGFENDRYLQGVSNGIRIEATGMSVTYFVEDEFSHWCVPGSRADSTLWWGFRFAPDMSDYPDTVLIGNYMIPPMDYIEPGPLETFFEFPVYFRNDYPDYFPSQIYVDSCAMVAPGGTWMWDDGTGNVNPTFNHGNGSHLITFTYLCGDANADGMVNVSDVVRIKNWIFLGGAAPDPMESGDVNCDGAVNVSDAVWIINWIFKNGNWPCDSDGDGIPDC